MNNLLVGNGINIQFNKKDYTAQQIVLRILKNCDRDDFPSHIIVDYPYLLKNYMGQLFLEARGILENKYDGFTNCNAEKESLKSFKKQYVDKIDTLRITDIGFEDYYLIHDLVCHKNNIENPEQYIIREAMRMAYLYAIYNDGKLNDLYKQYPEKFINYLKKFDNIFTTNYDANIESATYKQVYHIHGQFDKKSDVYLLDSFRNQLPDAPIKEIKVDEEYFYLYSTALTTHCGAYKELQIKQGAQANNAIEKMAMAYNSNPQIKQEIDNWTHESNKLTVNMGYAIQLKAANSALTFSDNYHFNTFKNITGRLEILGLSPWNDLHIFESINTSNIEECVYFYFNKNNCDIIRELLPELNAQGKIQFLPAKEFWEECYEK